MTKRALVLAVCLVSVATATLAQNAEPEVAGGTASIKDSGAGVPSSAAGDVAGASSGVMSNSKSGIGDRRTLDDLRAGTSGTTQTR